MALFMAKLNAQAGKVRHFLFFNKSITTPYPSCQLYHRAEYLT